MRLNKVLVDGDQAERFPVAVKQQHYFEVVKVTEGSQRQCKKYLSIILLVALGETYLSKVKIEFGLKRGYKRLRP